MRDRERQTDRQKEIWCCRRTKEFAISKNKEYARKYKYLMIMVLTRIMHKIIKQLMT
jgi:hypothetical protein